MKISIVAAAILMAATATAQAKASSSAELTGLVISVKPISTMEGAATPYVRFTSGSDYLEINSLTQYPSSYQYGISGTPGFFSEATLSTTPAFAGAQASIQGDPFSKTGGSISASSFAYGTAGQISTASAHTVVGDNSGFASFTLGPNTRLDVTAIYDVSAFVGSSSFASFAGAYESAAVTAGLTLLPGVGQSGQGSFDGFGHNVARAGSYVDSPYFDQGELSVSYEGSESSQTYGLFMASVTASTVSNVPIPEPSNIALMLAGLWVLAWRGRRKASAVSSMTMSAS
jgi:hypothetical protein